jgi:hypothetical protein
MTYTLLQICTFAADEIGISRPSSVIASSEPDVQKLLRYANKTGNRMMKAYAWQQLRRGSTFSALGQYEQTGILPADFDRVVTETFWNRSTTVNIAGPIADVQWESLLAQNINSPNQNYFIYRDNEILIYPAPGVTNTLAFTYVNKNYVIDGDTSAEKDAFTKDTDTTVLDDELLIQGIIFEFLDNDGQPAQTAFQKYTDRFNLLVGHDQPSAAILQAGDIFGRFSRHLSGAPGANNVQGLY